MTRLIQASKENHLCEPTVLLTCNLNTSWHANCSRRNATIDTNTFRRETRRNTCNMSCCSDSDRQIHRGIRVISDRQMHISVGVFTLHRVKVTWQCATANSSKTFFVTSQSVENHRSCTRDVDVGSHSSPHSWLSDACLVFSKQICALSNLVSCLSGAGTLRSPC